jgi:hypothetical protein
MIISQWINTLCEDRSHRSKRQRHGRWRRRHLGRHLGHWESLEARRLLANWSGDIPNGTVWSNSEVQRIVGDARVPAGATLTIEPGTIVKFNEFSAIDLFVEGTLIADGTAGQPIIFTSRRDDVGGDTNGDGNASAPGSGEWNTITFGSASTANVLDQVEVRYGGGGGPGMVVVNGAALALSNSVIRNSSSAGVRIATSNPTLTSNTFQTNTGAAVSMDLASNPAISGVTLANNGVNGLLVDSGTLTGSRFWDDPDIVYRLAHDVIVDAGATLTIAPGQVVKLLSFAASDLFVNGTLNADGTAARPIIFTTDRDDTAGGDTNNNGAESLGNGQWNTISFGATSTANVLDHVEMRHGGGGGPGMVVVNGAALALSNSVIRNSASAGVRIATSNPTLTTNSFQSNSGAAVSMDLASNPAISGVTIANNGVNGLLVDSGTLTGTRFWDDPDIVYRLAHDVTVDAGATLTIAPGQVVKLLSFSANDLFVNGTLNADGTAARPIIFTTDRDDTAGGDTNNNGAENPGNGQWNTISFGATSTANVLDHVEFRHGGGGGPGMVVVGGAALTLSNSVLRNSASHGVFIVGATTQVSGNTLARNTDAGIRAEVGSVVTAVNNVLDYNRTGISVAGANVSLLNNTIVFNETGILAENAAQIVAANNIVAYQSFRGVAAAGTGQVALHFNDVFNPTASQGNFSGVPNPQGARGNISRDPRFFGRGLSGDYRLFAGSPAIDAGLSSDAALSITAPATDANGNPRFDDPGIAPNTGSGNPNFYDLGAFERQAVSEPDADLSIVLNAAPSAALVGDEVTFSWTVTNLGPNSVDVPWVDRVSIVFDDPRARAPLPILEQERTTSLDVGGSYRVQATARLPGLRPGTYRWVVETDAHHHVFEALLEGNNQVVSAPVAVDMRQLVLGSPLAGQFTAVESERWYKVDVQDDQSVRVALTPQSPQGLAELFVGAGYYLESLEATDPGAQRAPTLDFETTHDEFYYVLARGFQLGPEAAAYQILAETLGFEILDVTPDAGGNAGQVTVTVSGQAIPENATARLLTATGQQIVAATIHHSNTTQLVATFDLRGAAAGAADLIVEAGGGVRTLNDVFRIDTGGSADFFLQVTGPQNVRIDRPVEYTVTWGNRGNLDAPAHLVKLSASDLARIAFHPAGENLSNGYQFLAMADDTATASLPPGTRETAKFLVTTSGFGNFSVDAEYVAINDPRLAAETINWEAIRAEARPDLLTVEQWNELLNQVIVQTGNNWAGFAQRLAANSLEFLRSEPAPGSNRTAAVSLETGLLAELGSAEQALGWRARSLTVAAAGEEGGARAEPPGQILSLVVVPYDYPGNLILGGPLDSASGDAAAIRDLLRGPGKVPAARIKTLSDAPGIKTVSRVELGDENDYLLDPKRDPNSVLGQLRKLREEARPQDTIFFYFSGHSDSQGGLNIRENDFLGYSRLLSRLNLTKAGKIVVVIDGCKVGPAITELAELVRQGNVSAAEAARFTIVTGTSVADPQQNGWSDQYQSGISQFTYYFTQAMSNPANDLNRDGMVSIGEGFRGMPIDVAPVFRPAQLPSMQGNDVILCDPVGAAIQAGKSLVKQSPSGTGRAGVNGRSGAGSDPNDKAGPGFGDAGWVAPGESLSYVIRFENIAPPGVPADFIFPAQQVVVTDPLPAELDLSTFELGAIHFGGTHVDVPAGRKEFQFHVEVPHDPNPVEITVGLDEPTRTVAWRMRSYDVATGDFPDDPLAGFLPVNDATHKGEGFVSFRVAPSAGLANGTRFSNSASIVFDTNAAIVTNSVATTIDSLLPTSSVGPLPSEVNGNTFNVSWSGNDGVGSGVATYDVFVSVDGGPFTRWLDDTTNLVAQYSGAAGHRYAFYSVATDNVGHTEAAPSQPDAATMVTGSSLATINGTDGNDTYHVVRVGSQLHIYENVPPVGQPTYSSEIAALGPSVTINTLGGNDAVTVNTGGQPTLGLTQLIYNSGTGANTLVLENGSARIDSSVAASGVLNTTIAAGAQLSTSQLKQNGLTLGAGSRVTVLAGGTGTNVLTTLDLGATGTLDLNDNDLVLHTTEAGKTAALGALYSRLVAGFAGGNWNGNGVVSTAARTISNTTLSLVDNAVLGHGAFGGEPVDANSLLLKYTYYGDIDQNGQVDADDLTVFANNFGRMSGARQVDGDIDFNGTVDADDLTVFANNFLRGVGTQLVSSFPSSAWERTDAKLRFAGAAEVAVSLVAPTKRSLPRRAELGNQNEDENLVDLLARAIAADTAAARGESLGDARLASSELMSLSDEIWSAV